MGTLRGATKTSTYRNANGVYLKMMNFRAIDPAFIRQGKVGMVSGAELEKKIWAEFAADDQARKAAVADIKAAARLAGTSDGRIAELTDEEDEWEATEGGITYRQHRRYERSHGLARRKRDAVRASKGALRCEVCDLDFEERYGCMGADFIEVHHKKPVHTMKPGEKTKLADLALLCSNCHRIVHRKIIPVSLDELRTNLKKP